MALYPSLEDMKVDQLLKAQQSATNQYHPPPSSKQIKLDFTPSAPCLSTMESGRAPQYPALNDYMGLELTRDVIAANMPEYLDNFQNMQLTTPPQLPVETTSKIGGLIAPISGQSLGLYQAHVTNGIRQVILCKDYDKKVGLRVQAVNNGVFVSLVTKNSPAALAGLRFGDQILEVNGQSVAGFSMDDVHSLIKKAPANNVPLVVRDRPFERTITLHKDSTGHMGFSFKDGKVVGLVINSSAAKNGLLTEHNLLEVNGQNVVGLKDKEITKILSEAGDTITITVMPSFVFQHMTKRISTSLIKNLMDHSVPLM